jgi:hypothetical protein
MTVKNKTVPSKHSQWSDSLVHNPMALAVQTLKHQHPPKPVNRQTKRAAKAMRRKVNGTTSNRT